MYAVVEAGGKQYRLQVGDVVDVEIMPVEPGQKVELERVLMLGGEDGVKVGQPLVPGAKVLTTVVDHGKADKVISFKYKPKVRYRRRVGHRQPFTRLSVQEIVPGE
ncbi:MAG: 50S ribosomal protein L21 [Chloroflexi bacterium]|nr:50S ribosomal protein L21 [Chloroflexota bacterium]MCL5110007.1 50S ribosomal protein L21 [Chloroflexota bacterium]